MLKSTDYDDDKNIEKVLENENVEEDEKICNALFETLLYYLEKNSLMYFNDIFNGKERILFENDDE